MNPSFSDAKQRLDGAVRAAVTAFYEQEGVDASRDIVTHWACIVAVARVGDEPDSDSTAIVELYPPGGLPKWQAVGLYRAGAVYAEQELLGSGEG